MAGPSGGALSYADLLSLLNSIFGISTGGIPTPWMMQPAVSLYNARPVAAATQTTWFDFRNGKRLLIDVVSTLDQACVIQLVGNSITGSYATAKLVGGPLACPIGVPTTSGLDIGVGINDDWHPYIGLIINCAVLPAAGNLAINGIMQL